MLLSRMDVVPFRRFHPTFPFITINDMSKVTRRIIEPERPWGGQYAPESLMDSLGDLEDAFKFFWNDISFRQEFDTHLAEIRSPSSLQLARKLTKAAGGARIYLKREDQNFTGSHAIVNALGQGLLARRLGRSTILAETASGSHGVATAAVCLKLGLQCIVYMGVNDARARPDQVQRMEMYGAKVVEVSLGTGTLRDAIAEVLRAAVEQHDTAYPLLGGAYGPRPIPMIAKAFQASIGAEAKDQILDTIGRLPSAVIATAGIHCPAVGFFDSFVENRSVRLVAVEGAGCGIETGLHSAVLTVGTPGVYHGAHTLLLHNEHGQVDQVYSAGHDLCYPAVSPMLAQWTAKGRVEPIAIRDDQAAFGSAVLTQFEGIECGIEDGHAIVAGMNVARRMGRDESIVICLGGGA